MDDLRFSSLTTEDSVSRLALIGVILGIKPAFMGDEEEYFEEYQEAGRRLGLRILLTRRPPTDRYLFRTPRVPASFIEAFHGMGVSRERRTVWAYREGKVLEGISRSVAGRLNEGFVLGYPECCVRRYDEDRVVFLENIYNHIINRYHPDGDRAAVRILLTDPPVPPPNNPVRESFRSFPFISYIACHACLDGSSEKSGRLSSAFAQVAAQTGLDQTIRASIMKFLSGQGGTRAGTT